MCPSICVISTYPQRGVNNANDGGVASYTRKLVSNFAAGFSSVVVADLSGDDQSEYYEGKSVRVIRCWHRGIGGLFQIYNAVRSTKCEVIHVQHEYFLYGGLETIPFFPILLLLLRGLGHPIVLTIHGVIPLYETDFRDIGLRSNSRAMKMGLLAITRILGAMADQVIVHEEYFKDLLIKQYRVSQDKIRVVNHGVDQDAILVDRDVARDKLNLPTNKKIVLFFGYLAPYKGLSLLLDAFTILRARGYNLIVAGGLHPRLKQDGWYLSEVRSLAARSASNDAIVFVGFVPDDLVMYYFRAADLVLFPYLASISVSGPMCLASSFERPFLVSTNLLAIIRNVALTFPPRPEALSRKIESILDDEEKLNELTRFSVDYRDAHSWQAESSLTCRIYERMLH